MKWMSPLYTAEEPKPEEPPSQAYMTCARCRVSEPMSYLPGDGWRHPDRWVLVRRRYYCKACIDAFEGVGCEG